MCLPRKPGDKTLDLTDNKYDESNSNDSHSSSNKTNNTNINFNDQFNPFIPGFVIGSDNSVIIWHFPYGISQSRIANRKTVSSACSIICSILAEEMYRNGIRVPSFNNQIYIDHDKKFYFNNNSYNNIDNFSKINLLPSRIFYAMVNSILDGNDICDRAILDENTDLFNIPQALEKTNNQMGEIGYVTSTDIVGSAFILIYSALKCAIKNELTSSFEQLFFMLLLLERCVLIVYQRCSDSIMVLDTHTHKQIGAICLLGSGKNLQTFCKCLLNKLFPETEGVKPANLQFELSLIYFKGDTSYNFCPMDKYDLIRGKTLALMPKSIRDSVFNEMTNYMRNYIQKQIFYNSKKAKKRYLKSNG